MSDVVPEEIRERVISMMRYLRSLTRDDEYLRCLIAYHAAPTLLGIKPATLFCPDASGRNLDKALGDCAPCLTRELGVEIAGFRNRAGALLLLVYRPELVATTLKAEDVAALLRENGYEVNGADCRALVEKIGRKCSGASFPHEIGVILGYPVDDVRRFMQDARKSARRNSPTGAWKAYRNVDDALRAGERYREAKMLAARMIVGGENIQTLCHSL